ncbi:MAG TPA: cyclic nucleotide-binding domain-containing protein [Bryobacteraceae bacterium]|nr:cyclic nucleotide-binding domain-containing protein [Bryobacteraceae bacterium]
MTPEKEKDTSNRELLTKCAGPELAKILFDYGIEAYVSHGTTLFEPGDQSGQFYLITEGSVAIEQPGTTCSTRVETLKAGDLLGWSALIGSGTRHFTARALTDVSALSFDGATLRRACERDPQFGYKLMLRLLLLVTERLDATRNRLSDARDRRI